MLPGWFLFVYKRERLLETSFPLSLLASVIFSSALVFRDVGRREMDGTSPRRDIASINRSALKSIFRQTGIRDQSYCDPGGNGGRMAL